MILLCKFLFVRIAMKTMSNSFYEYNLEYKENTCNAFVISFPGNDSPLFVPLPHW